MSLGRAVALGLGAYAVFGGGGKPSKGGLHPRVLVLRNVTQYAELRERNICRVGTIVKDLSMLSIWRKAALAVVGEHPGVYFFAASATDIPIVAEALELEGVAWKTGTFFGSITMGGEETLFETGNTDPAGLAASVAEAAEFCP